MAKTFKKIILDDLKKRGLQHLAAKITSIRYDCYSGGDSVSVKALNLFGKDRDTLEVVLREYQHGWFDGMTDYYNYEPTKTERSAKFVSLDVDYCEVTEEEARQALARRGVFDDQTAMLCMGVWYDQAKYRLIREVNA